MCRLWQLIYIKIMDQTELSKKDFDLQVEKVNKLQNRMIHFDIELVTLKMLLMGEGIIDCEAFEELLIKIEEEFKEYHKKNGKE